MSPRLEKIKTANEVINHNNPDWKEEVDWLINMAEKLETKLNKEAEIGLSLEGQLYEWKDKAERYESAIKTIM